MWYQPKKGIKTDELPDGDFSRMNSMCEKQMHTHGCGSNVMREIYKEQRFFKLELLIEFINNHNIKVISIFPNNYYEVRHIDGKEFKCQDYILIYSYMEEL